MNTKTTTSTNSSSSSSSSSMIPFSEDERKIKYKFVKFNELDIEYTFLNPINLIKTKNLSNNYKFGFVYNKNLFWFFNGKVVAKNRESMRKIWLELKKIEEKSPQYSVFVFKVR